MNVVVVDNFDSFTYNLVEYVSEQALGRPAVAAGGESDAETDSTVDGDDGPVADITVFKNTASLAAVEDADPDAILISPGPGHPKNERDVGVTGPVLRELSPSVPTLGVCLGLESAVHEYGGTVGHAPEPIHGKAFPVEHDGAGVFAGLDQGFRAGRYHSLIATEVPDALAVTATTTHGDESLVMGVRHERHPIEAVQFHPESVLTAVGHDIIENFLASVRSGTVD
jgi:anthranilate synthase component 2